MTRVFAGSSTLILMILGATVVEAQVDAPVPSGLYEAYSPIFHRPVGRLDPGRPTLLPQWLEVVTTGQVSHVTFQPDGRVTWQLTYGPNGLVEKLTSVDGQPWSRSIFTYDERGLLQRKEVTGPGIVNGPWVFTYRHDARGRVIERLGTMVMRRTWSERNLPPESRPERWTVRYGQRIEVRRYIGGDEVRSDQYDLAGRPLRTDFFDSGPPCSQASLVYVRTSTGRLRRILRVRGGRATPAVFSRPDPRLTAPDLRVLYNSQVERQEALLLLGSPQSESDTGHGAARRIVQQFGEPCWLNELSALEYDATGLLVSAYQACICGYCVDASLPVEAAAVEGVDLHWTRGPWLRLDDEVDVTVDHTVATPLGPRRADALRPGDVILTSHGALRVLRSVRPLPLGPERLGRNVRTASGFFGAGGIRFASEPLCNGNAHP